MRGLAAVLAALILTVPTLADDDGPGRGRHRDRGGHEAREFRGGGDDSLRPPNRGGPRLRGGRGDGDGRDHDDRRRRGWTWDGDGGDGDGRRRHDWNGGGHGRHYNPHYTYNHYGNHYGHNFRYNHHNDFYWRGAPYTPRRYAYSHHYPRHVWYGRTALPRGYHFRHRYYVGAYWPYRYGWVDYRPYYLSPPPYGHRWARCPDGDFYLIAIATGLIVGLALNDAYYY